MKHRFAFGACSVFALAAAATPVSAGTDAYIGEVTPGGYNFCPRGSAMMNGQILSIAQNTALFALIGTTYGGNGQTTFALPNLQGRVPMHQGTGPGLTPRNLGEQSGTETNTLLLTQLPAHNHTASLNVNNTATPDSGNPTGNVFARSSILIYENTASPTPGVTMMPGTVTVGSTGGNQPVNNMQPFLALNYCIVTEGIFPPRN